jgi:hypothetical protein
LSLCRLDSRSEGVDVVGAVLAAAIDEERGDARHSAGAGRVDVIGHPAGADVAAHILAEPVDVQPEVGGVTHQVNRAQFLLML